jgi:hypothetical protein
MSIENIPDGDVYNGNFEEKLEAKLYKCVGRLEIEINTHDRMLEGLKIDELNLCYEAITVKLELKELIQAWDKRQADDMWHNIIEHNKRNVNKMVTYNEIRGDVKHTSEECEVIHKPRK